MENEIKPNYDIIKEQFILIAKEFKACESFIQDITQISDKNSFKRRFSKT